MKEKYPTRKFKKEMIMDAKRIKEMCDSNMRVKDLNKIIKGKKS